MSLYIAIKYANGTKTIGLKDTEPSKPYIKMKEGYLQLTSNTTKTGLFVKGNNTTYRIVESETITRSYDTTVNTTTSVNTQSTYNEYDTEYRTYETTRTLFNITFSRGIYNNVGWLRYNRSSNGTYATSYYNYYYTRNGGNDDQYYNNVSLYTYLEYNFTDYWGATGAGVSNTSILGDFKYTISIPNEIQQYCRFISSERTRTMSFNGSTSETLRVTEDTKYFKGRDYPFYTYPGFATTSARYSRSGSVSSSGVLRSINFIYTFPSKVYNKTSVATYTSSLGMEDVFKYICDADPSSYFTYYLPDYSISFYDSNSNSYYMSNNVKSIYTGHYYLSGSTVSNPGSNTSNRTYSSYHKNYHNIISFTGNNSFSFWVKQNLKTVSIASTKTYTKTSYYTVESNTTIQTTSQETITISE